MGYLPLIAPGFRRASKIRVLRLFPLGNAADPLSQHGALVMQGPKALDQEGEVGLVKYTEPPPPLREEGRPPLPPHIEPSVRPPIHGSAGQRSPFVVLVIPAATVGCSFPSCYHLSIPSHLFPVNPSVPLPFHQHPLASPSAALYSSTSGCHCHF